MRISVLLTAWCVEHHALGGPNLGLVGGFPIAKVGGAYLAPISTAHTQQRVIRAPCVTVRSRASQVGSFLSLSRM
jgi:hypothetical protein